MTTAPALLITGTDTEIGKTIVTAAIAAYWQTYLRPDNPHSLGIYKPIQCGSGDREFFQQVLDLDQSLAQITPQHFLEPLAPPIAARKSAQAIDLALLWQQFNLLRSQKQFVLVEALGGLGSPLTEEYIVADLARDWALPTVLVVPVKIGAVGQAIANVALAHANLARLELLTQAKTKLLDYHHHWQNHSRSELLLVAIESAHPHHSQHQSQACL
jgi:dethiobiotin synthetase